MSLFPNTVLLLCFHAVLDVHIAPSVFITEVSPKPKAFDLARYQASQADCTWVTSLDNKVTAVSADEVSVLRKLDGTHTRDALGSDLVLESLCAKKLLVA
jgi:methyltransferase-like protein